MCSLSHTYVCTYKPAHFTPQTVEMIPCTDRGVDWYIETGDVNGVFTYPQTQLLVSLIAEML